MNRTGTILTIAAGLVVTLY